MDELDESIKKQGYSGSTDIPKIVYLAAISRVFDDPVSLVVMGPSGSGKTYSIESGLQFITPSAIESIAGMSEKALPYLNIPLKHRVLFLGEASGMADGQGRTFLRQLMTEGKIDYLTVQKSQNGMDGAKLPTTEGPVCFMMATTANRIHHEDQSRMLVLNMVEDPARVREALRNQARGLTKSTVKLDLTPWHDLCDYIADNKMTVRIPYAERIADLLPTTGYKIQRDFPKVLALVRACALVHYNQRQTEGESGILADRSDYETVYALINKPLSEGIEATVKQPVRTVVEKVAELQAVGHSGDGISHSKLAEVLGIDRSTVGRNINAGISAGYLENRNPGQGKEAKVVLGERKLENGSVLPSPDEVFHSQRKPALAW
ncbi:hypothetical protein [Mesorhizobium sp. YM1C-6-2]|uniref:hypothetical protein n=1 Tax=Mesorhizobium sp. YM1C-6-2 TaxID=1827501 RepID=UPI0011C3E134|nr:hypothetical protein [Mesorhizobium sp. YM1C-6-2]